MKEEKIKVLALLPMELPKEIDLDNTLEAMQKFVDGNIECLTFYDAGSEVILVCNDEGKLLGLPLNRPLWDGADVLAGPGFLAGCDNDTSNAPTRNLPGGVNKTSKKPRTAPPERLCSSGFLLFRRGVLGAQSSLLKLLRVSEVFLLGRACPKPCWNEYGKLELVGARPLHLLSQTVRSLKSPTGLSLLRKREFHLLR